MKPVGTRNFGDLFAESTNVVGLYYMYNGKELDRTYGLDWHDYGARHYDAARMQWTTVDPLCEKYYELSPYAMCGDNPITFIDPHGDTIVVAGNIGMFATSVYNAMPHGKSVSGNAGVSLFPNSSVSGQISTNQNIQIHINSKSTVNHQSIGLAHELIHVKRYMRGQPHSHLSNSFNNYLYSRLESLYKRLGYDYVDY